MGPTMVVWTTWAGIIVALAGVAVAAISLFPAMRAAKTAREQTELQRQIVREAAQPRVWADVRGSPGRPDLLELVVGNSGTTAATNVHVTIDPQLPLSFGPDLDDKDPSPAVRGQRHLRNGVASIAPSRELRWPLIFTPEWPDTLPLYHVTITADGPYGPVAPTEYDLDIQLMRYTCRKTRQVVMR